MKKYLLLLLLVILMTGCDVQYNLEYKNNVFKESATIKTEKNEDLTFPTLRDISSDKKNFKITDVETYGYNYDYNETSNIEKLNVHFEYQHLPITESYVYKNCFESKLFLDQNNTYYINLGGDVTCKFLNKVKVTFKTDKKVIKTNALVKNDAEGIYEWDTLDNGIVILVSKTALINKKVSILDSGFKTRLIIVLVLSIVILIGYKIIKVKNEK